MAVIFDASLYGDALEQYRRVIAISGIRQDDYQQFAFVFRLRRHFDRRGDCGAGGNSGCDPLFFMKAMRHFDGFIA